MNSHPLPGRGSQALAFPTGQAPRADMSQALPPVPASNVDTLVLPLKFVNTWGVGGNHLCAGKEALSRAGLEPDEELFWEGKRTRLITPVKPGSSRDKPKNRYHKLRLTPKPWHGPRVGTGLSLPCILFKITKACPTHLFPLRSILPTACLCLWSTLGSPGEPGCTQVLSHVLGGSRF